MALTGFTLKKSVHNSVTRIHWIQKLSLAMCLCLPTLVVAQAAQADVIPRQSGLHLPLTVEQLSPDFVRQQVTGNHPETLKWALENPLLADAVNSYSHLETDSDYFSNLSLLSLASAVAPLEIVELLLRYGFDPNLGSSSGESALMIAAQNNPRLDVLQRLLAAGADPRLLSSQEQTSLHFAALNPNPEIIKTLLPLLEPSAYLSVDANQSSIFHLAAANPNPEILAAILTASIQSQLKLKDSLGQTPLHIAAEKNPNPQVIQDLLKFGANLSQQDSDSNQPLHLALPSASVEIIRLLLTPQNSHAANSEGERPLHLAAMNPRLEVLQLLLDAGAGSDLHVPTSRGLLPLHLAANNPNPEILKALLKLGAGQDLMKTDAQGLTALHHAAGKHQNLKRLLDLGADPRALDDTGMTALHKAAFHDSDKAAESILLLLNTEARKDLNLGAQGSTPLLLACYDGDPALVRALLAAGASQSFLIRDSSGKTPLHYAAGSSPFYEGEILNVMLAAGAGKGIAIKDDTGFTPLFDAVWNDDRSLKSLKALLAIAPPESVREKSSFGEPLLLLAVRYFGDNPQIVSSLLAAGARPDLNYLDDQGWGALHLVADRNKPETLKLLLAAGLGSQINRQNLEGNTPLHLAAQAHHAEVIRLLLAAGADPKPLNQEGQSALELAKPLPKHVKSAAYQLLLKAQ